MFYTLCDDNLKYKLDDSLIDSLTLWLNNITTPYMHRELPFFMQN